MILISNKSRSRFAILKMLGLECRCTTRSISLRRTCLVSGLAVSLVMSSCLSWAAELKRETLNSWNNYIQVTTLQLNSRTGASGRFLWLDEDPDRLRRVRTGEILIAPGGARVPMPVPAGLIHDWIGAAYIPHTNLQQVLGVVRDYDCYHEFYHPSVVESKSLQAAGEADQFSMVLVNKQVVALTALDSEYKAFYHKVDETRWYGIAYTTRIREIRDYGRPEQKELPPEQGSGYIWRLYSITRFEERDGGVYVELEAFALSRDVPPALRWMVDPIVRRVSKSALSTSLQQTREAVCSRSTDQSQYTAQLQAARPTRNSSPRR